MKNKNLKANFNDYNFIDDNGNNLTFQTNNSQQKSKVH